MDTWIVVWIISFTSALIAEILASFIRNWLYQQWRRHHPK